MSQQETSLSAIHALENNVETAATEHLRELLGYFRYIQETLLIAFHNAGGSVPVPNEPDNPKLLAFVMSARAFSIAKTAMDQTLRGYPLEGIALNRILAELAQCSQYLVRHPSLIDNFISGRKKLSDILKLAKIERDKGDSDSFGPFWGSMSRYAHASPDLLALPLKTEGNRMTISLVFSDLQMIEDAAYGIMVSLLTQYLIFRAVFLKDLSVESELNARDKFIFRPDNIRRFAKFGSISDKGLDELYRIAIGDSSSGK